MNPHEDPSLSPAPPPSLSSFSSDSIDSAHPRTSLDPVESLTMQDSQDSAHDSTGALSQDLSSSLHIEVSNLSSASVVNSQAEEVEEEEEEEDPAIEEPNEPAQVVESVQAAVEPVKEEKLPVKEDVLPVKEEEGEEEEGERRGSRASVFEALTPEELKKRMKNSFLDQKEFLSFSKWIVCFCVVAFDIEIGQGLGGFFHSLAFFFLWLLNFSPF